MASNSSSYHTAAEGSSLPSPSDFASPQEARLISLEACVAILEQELHEVREWVTYFFQHYHAQRLSPQGSDLSGSPFRDVSNVVSSRSGSRLASPSRRPLTPYHRGSFGASDIILSSPYHPPNTSLVVADTSPYPSSESSDYGAVIPTNVSSSESDSALMDCFHINQCFLRSSRRLPRVHRHPKN